MLKYFKYSVNTQIHSAYTVIRVEKLKISALKMQFIYIFPYLLYMQKI